MWVRYWLERCTGYEDFMSVSALLQSCPMFLLPSPSERAQRDYIRDSQASTWKNVWRYVCGFNNDGYAPLSTLVKESWPQLQLGSSVKHSRFCAAYVFTGATQMNNDEPHVTLLSRFLDPILMRPAGLCYGGLFVDWQAIKLYEACWCMFCTQIFFHSSCCLTLDRIIPSMKG